MENEEKKCCVIHIPMSFVLKIDLAVESTGMKKNALMLRMLEIGLNEIFGGKQ